MKFAVVEYSSKSGTIWRHRADKPNYLADPEKEIDPTSFGCYVSALDGEHIPLKGIIVGPVVPVSRTQIFSRRFIKKISGHWPQSYDASYLAQFDVLLVVHQISNGHEMTALVKRLRNMRKRPYIIGVPTQPFGILQDYAANNPSFLPDVKEFMAMCDVFLALVKSTQAHWQSLTTTPVTYLPQAYPIEYAAQAWRPLSAKQPILFVSGVTDRPVISRGQAVAKQLQQLFPEYTIHITDTPGYTPDVAELEGARFETKPFLPWLEQLQYLAMVRLVINTDYTQTRGRVQVDCAAVGTVSLGADSDGQVDLFPTLPATKDTALAMLVAQGQSLLKDHALYERTASYAKDKASDYNYGVSRQRVLHLLDKYPKKI